MTLTNQATQILNALRSYGESTTEYANGDVWASVYLDNARPDNMTASQFAGYLSALQAAGFYKPVDGAYFGEVKL
jgi:hypothetical protein